MSPTLELTQTGDAAAEVALRPDAGNPVTLYVVQWPGSNHYYVKRSPEPGSMGFISRHTAFENAVKSAIHRGKRYLASCQRTAKRKAAAA